MPRNIEVKARIESIEALTPRVAAQLVEGAYVDLLQPPPASPGSAA